MVADRLVVVSKKVLGWFDHFKERPCANNFSLFIEPIEERECPVSSLSVSERDLESAVLLIKGKVCLHKVQLTDNFKAIVDLLFYHHQLNKLR